MRKSVLVLGTLCLGGATALVAHDMFLKLRSWFLPPNTEVVVPLPGAGLLFEKLTVISVAVDAPRASYATAFSLCAPS